MAEPVPVDAEAARLRLHNDWAAIWQSECAALAQDREALELLGGAGIASAGPGPMCRRGPRPLMLHLASAGFGGADPALIAGIAAYRRHPARFSMSPPACIWSEGGSRLLDYAPNTAGRPVLFVPSLINRCTILDLAPGHSMMRFLAEQGVRPLLLDWGWPGQRERGFTLTDYVAGRLERALVAVAQPVVLAGYCMGGLMALAAAGRRPDLVQGLAVFATPWDFRAADATLSNIWPMLQPLVKNAGVLPVDALQGLFALLDPAGVAAKFRAFGGYDQDGKRAGLFVAIEDWVNDGVPLAGPVAEECFRSWYGGNTPVRGEWLITGLPVMPTSVAVPCFAAIPTRDRIVPPASARALAAMLAKVRVIEPECGHVGMLAGAAAADWLWQPFLDWLREV